MIDNIFFSILAQAGDVGLSVIDADSTQQILNDSNNVSTEKLTLWNMLVKGGVIMIPIGVLFLGAIYLFFERFFSLRRATTVDKRFMTKIQDYISHGDINGALRYCNDINTPVSRMLGKGLKKVGKPMQDIEKSLESAGKIEVLNLEKNLSILGTIAGIAPMFGFIGTIIGVIKIFFDISVSNDISINIIAAGLYTKMVASAGGLIVGILAHSAYHYLVFKIDREVYKMEANAIQFIDLLQEPTI
jgi:biopolymer transport protein ExbB